MNYMTSAEIIDWQPFAIVNDGLTPIQRARARVTAAGQWDAKQNMGRRWAIGCVALEITQRCNLDCTLCYLSESSEALKDIPIEEVFRRIDLIHAHYGDGTDIQVTGGDPTLRQRDELVQIVRYIRDKHMRCSLFTNGILATREMLAELAENGLTDVAFHVDMTQERKGYDSEESMNKIRLDYINRARGLPLNVFFNTTVFDQNFHDIQMITRFFLAHADVVNLCSFQLQADTGRGVERERGFTITQASVHEQINLATGKELAFHAGTAGHHECNGHAIGYVCNGKMVDLLDDQELIEELLEKTDHILLNRRNPKKTAAQVGLFILTQPSLMFKTLRHFGRKLWETKADLLVARGKMHKMAFFTHNFQDAQHLEHDRCESCSFTVITPEGPMSMCVHNAKRDAYLLVSAKVVRNANVLYFNPATGEMMEQEPEKIEVKLTRKNARGRSKEEVNKNRPPRRDTKASAVATG